MRDGLLGNRAAYGPNINRSMPEDALPKARAAIREARVRAVFASDKERAYIDGLAKRYDAKSSSEQAIRDVAYANAMRRVSASYPDDPDAATLFAAALMEIHPWDWWNEGRRTPEVGEAIQTVEAVLRRQPEHIGANHYHIHALETGPDVARALASANRLHEMAPNAGHLLHMPSHVYLRLGMVHEASLANARAIAADRAYIARRGYGTYYVQHYYPHNASWYVFSTTMEGREDASMEMARAIADEVGTGRLEDETLCALPMFVQVRFGRRDDILRGHEPISRGPHVRFAWHYARGMAHAAKGELHEAKREAAEVARLAASADDVAGPVAHAVVESSIARAQRNPNRGVMWLERAVARSEKLPFVPTPRWYYPVRQSLGAALLEAGRPAEAERVYRADLDAYPANGWSLFGLAESLCAQGRSEEAGEVMRAFHRAWRWAEIELADSERPCRARKIAL